MASDWTVMSPPSSPSGTAAVTVSPPSIIASALIFWTLSVKAAAMSMLPSDVEAPCLEFAAPLTAAGFVPPEFTWPASLPAPPSIPSACLSAPDFCFPPAAGSGSPELLWFPPDPDPDPCEDEDDDDGAAPLALALDVDVVLFLALTVTLTFLAFTLLESLATVESFRTSIEKDPPAATLSPAAAALAESILVMVESAWITTSPFDTSSRVPDPRCALVSVPVTSSDSTGVMEMPPAEPAAAVTDWLSVEVAVISTPERGLVVVICVPSLISAMFSMPVTWTAIPAPTPALLETPSPLASAFVSNLVEDEVVDESVPPSSFSFAVSSTVESTLLLPTWTATAPPIPMSPWLYPASASTVCTVVPSALMLRPAASIVAFSTFAITVFLSTPTATDTPADTVLLPPAPEPPCGWTPTLNCALTSATDPSARPAGSATVYSVPVPVALTTVVVVPDVMATSTVPGVIL